MIRQIADLHIHSKYSRACSRDLELPKIADTAAMKGINIVATGDFTHPGWLAHIKETLSETNNGLYQIKSDNTRFSLNKTKFILSTEISCIYKDKDATRRLHLVILAPNIEAVDKLVARLEDLGANLHSDGRPIIGLSAKKLLEILLDIDERFLLIPAHAWTPWFSIFGSKSGYNSVEECFEELAPNIRALETGLSSDPTMNHLWSALDNYTLVSNSDAHSLEKLGREANVFSFNNESEISYQEITRIIREGDKKKFLFTIEFFPEEGKYHFDGHASCKICFSPKETRKEKYLCPKCKKKLTVGVLHRVEELSDRNENEILHDKYIPHRYLVPLQEIISFVFKVGVKSKKVKIEYDRLVKKIGSEFFILLDAPIDQIKKTASDINIASAIANIRLGKIKIFPGYDGVFGRIDLSVDLYKEKNLQKRLLLE